MKKKPTPTGEEDGRTKPSAKDSWMYFSMDSSVKTGYTTDWQGEVHLGANPLRNHNVCVAVERELTVCWKLQLNHGTREDKSGGPNGGGRDGATGVTADLRQCEWQKTLQLTIDLANQSMWGLCIFSQGRPRTTGELAEEMTRSWVVSWWLPEMNSAMGAVRWVMWANNFPSRAFTSLEGFITSVGLLAWRTRLESTKLS